MNDKVTLTTTAGASIGDNQNGVTTGRHGPVLVQDHQLLEKLAHQNRERTPRKAIGTLGDLSRHTLHRLGDIVHQPLLRLFANETEQIVSSAISPKPTRVAPKELLTRSA